VALGETKETSSRNGESEGSRRCQRLARIGGKRGAKTFRKKRVPRSFMTSDSGIVGGKK